MPSPEIVRERLAARARRTTRIRRGVGAATLAAFALAWGLIAHDGSMGAATTTTASTAATDRPAATASEADADAPVTTAQS